MQNEASGAVKTERRDTKPAFTRNQPQNNRQYQNQNQNRKPNFGQSNQRPATTLATSTVEQNQPHYEIQEQLQTYATSNSEQAHLNTVPKVEHEQEAYVKYEESAGVEPEYEYENDTVQQ